MAIIQTTDKATSNEYINLFPDLFVTEKEKNSNDYVKQTMDFFSNIAYSQYTQKERKITKNYQLLNGIITSEDFYEPEVRNFTASLLKNAPLPSHVQHYPIMNPYINQMIGEVSTRPDNARVKAFDADSQNEELQAKTQVLQDYILQGAREKIMMKVAKQNGVSPNDLMASKEGSNQVEQMTEQEVAGYMMSYTSTAENWSNHVLESLRLDFNIKEQSEEAFKDLLVTSEEWYHIYENNSRLGFTSKVENAKNIWNLTTPNKKYSRDSYAIGTINLMELSEIIDTFILTEDEINFLKKGTHGFEQGNIRTSNLFTNTKGDKSVTYDTYSEAQVREKMLAESQLKDNNTALEQFMGINNNIGSFGSKFIVIRSYWKSKKRQGKLLYMDPITNTPQTIIVDETYKKIPEEISIEWGYINQWWTGVKIGDAIYYSEPYLLLDYPPIIGVIHNNKNSEAKSLVDLVKPFQTLYNICMNQLFELLDKEIGNVARVSLRRIPRLKDGDDQDALDQWEMQARERGFIFDDDSPENTQGSVSNQNIAGSIDLTRSSEIQSRYNLAATIKNECGELLGFTRQRLGSSMATETATSINNGLAQSYAQTEPYFKQHEYLLNQYYQALLDVSLYIESSKPESTIRYISNDGDSKFIQVNGADLKLRDLKVFVTSRSEDQKVFQELRQLSQAMLQNGASIYDVAVLYSTNSVRQMKDTFKKLDEYQKQMQQQEQDSKQQELQQSQQQFEYTMQENSRVREQEMINNNYQKELDRINRKEVAIINTFSKQDDNLKDTNMDGSPDLIEYSRLSSDQLIAQQDHERELAKISSDSQKHTDNMKIALEGIKLEKEKLKQEKELKEKELATKLTVAKYGDKGTKNSPRKK